MIKLKDFLEAQKVIEKQISKSRYFLDIRVGCGAVRDKLHEFYEEDYPGLHSETPDVVEYKAGHFINGVWEMREEDIKYLKDLCEKLNNKDKNI